MRSAATLSLASRHVKDRLTPSYANCGSTIATGWRKVQIRDAWHSVNNYWKNNAFDMLFVHISLHCNDFRYQQNGSALTQPPNHFHKILSIQSPHRVGCRRLSMNKVRSHKGKQTYGFLRTMAAAIFLAASVSGVTPGFADLIV